MNETVSQVSRFLKLNKWYLVTAESCTGGWVAKVMTDLAGSSDCFDRGFVTYSNAAKRDMLGVSKMTLDTCGAVSEEVVREMVNGALQRSSAQIAVAISGLAGPGGGTPKKPVGTVCFAWQKTGEQPLSATCYFDGDRDTIRRQSVDYVLRGILRHYN